MDDVIGKTLVPFPDHLPYVGLLTNDDTDRCNGVWCLLAHSSTEIGYDGIHLCPRRYPGKKLLFADNALKFALQARKPIEAAAIERQYKMVAGDRLTGLKASEHCAGMSKWDQPWIDELPTNWMKLGYDPVNPQKNQVSCWHVEPWINYWLTWWIKAKLISVEILRESQSGKSFIGSVTWKDAKPPDFPELRELQRLHAMKEW